MEWKTRNSIPSKRRLARTEPEYQGHKGKRTQTWKGLAHDFLASGDTTAELMFDKDTYSADTVLSNLNSTVRHNRIRGVRFVRRGDRVYATRESETRADPREIVDTLYLFDGSGQAHSLLPWPVESETERRRLYKSFHYHRTREGFGHISLRYTSEGVVLINPFAD